MRAGLLLLSLVASSAPAQTPMAIPQFAEPPEANGASPAVYPRHILWNSGLTCLQRPWGTSWSCFVTSSEMAAATGSLGARLGTLEAQVPVVQALASGAASAASAAQVASGSNASAITALTTRLAAAEAALASAQKRTCTTFTVASGLSVPLTGISTVTNVPLTGVPVGTDCDVGAPSRMPLGARPDPVVLVAGTVNMAFVSNGGLLSSVIAIPSGTYRVCCDL